MVQCPHCFLTVLATAEGNCPACAESLTNTESKWATMKVFPATVLPSVCCVCNQPTTATRSVQLGRWNSELENGPQVGLGCLLTAMTLLNPIALLLRLVFLLTNAVLFLASKVIAAPAKSRQTVVIPICKECRDELRVIEDTDEYMTLRVARSYLEAMEQPLPIDSNPNPYVPPRMQ